MRDRVQLPEIHQAEKLRVEPGDILVVRNSEVDIDQEQAMDIRDAIRRTLSMPNLPVLVLGRDWDVIAADPGDYEVTPQ